MELNEAREIVIDYLDSKGKGTAQKGNNINEQKINYFRELKAKYLNEVLVELAYISSINSLDIIFAKNYGRFRELIDEFYQEINKNYDGIELQHIYRGYHIKYHELLIYYLYEHWKVSKITSFIDGDIKVTKEITLEEVRNKMLEIINNIFEIELEKYKTIEDYKIIAPILLGVKTAYNQVCLFGFDSIENLKKRFNNAVRKEINKYYKRKKLLEELVELEGEVLPHSIVLHNSILDEEVFYELYNKIDKPSKTKIIAKKVIKLLKK